MEIKGIPVVKPLGGVATPTPVAKPIGVASVPPVVKPVVPVTIPTVGAKEAPVVVIPEPTLNPTNPVKTLVEEEAPKGGLFGGGSVTETPKVERLNDVKNAVNKVSNKTTDEADDEIDENDDEVTTKTAPKKKEPKFVVPLKVRIYDREVFVIDDPKTTEEEIRLKAVNELNFFEFDKERTKFIYNDAKNEVVLKASFEKRG